MATMRPFFLRFILPAVASTLILFAFFALRRQEDFDSTFFRTHGPSNGWNHKSSKYCSNAPSTSTFKDDLTFRNYTRAVIRPRFVSNEQPSLAYIDDSVLSPFNLLPPGHRSSDSKIECLSIATVDVTVNAPQDPTEAILFGITTPLERLNAHLREIGYFLQPSKASLLVMVPGDLDLDVLQTKEEEYRNLGLDITLVTSMEEQYETRYFSLVQALGDYIQSSRPWTKWIATLDDDTFFPQLPRIAHRLSKLDHTQPHWIGAHSESSWRVGWWGGYGFGGAGIFLSSSLFERMWDSYDECTTLNYSPGDWAVAGDDRIGRCVHHVEPGLNLTMWKELRQWDIAGSTDGVFESGRPIWTLHHWGNTGWFNMDVLKACATSQIAGQASIFQRWMFDRSGGWDESQERSYYVLTNGHSIIRYEIEAGFKDIDFSETEYTWNDGPSDFTEGPEAFEQYLGPFRATEAPGVTKKRWVLEDVVRLGANIHQFYKYRENGENSIIELVWLGE